MKWFSYDERQKEYVDVVGSGFRYGSWCYGNRDTTDNDGTNMKPLFEVQTMIIESWRCYWCSDKMQRRKKPQNGCKNCYANVSRRQAEEELKDIVKLKDNPILMQKVGNMIWGQHERRIGLRTRR